MLMRDLRGLNGFRACLATLGVFVVGACGNSDAETASSHVEGVAAAVEKKVDDEVEKAGLGSMFDPEDKAFRKRACEFLTPEMVSAAFDVPANDLKQTKIMGCIYSWNSDETAVQAQLMLIMVHKSLDRAKLWFKNSTADKTKEELDGELEQVKEQVQKREELNTELKKKTAGDITDLAKLGMPSEGVRYQAVPGVGDEARIADSDGTMTVRLGNVTFRLSAYKGSPKPDIKFDPKNLKGMAKAAMEVQKKWVQDTVEQRMAAAKKLAPGVVKAMQAAKN